MNRSRTLRAFVPYTSLSLIISSMMLDGKPQSLASSLISIMKLSTSSLTPCVRLYHLHLEKITFDFGVTYSRNLVHTVSRLLRFSASVVSDVTSSYSCCALGVVRLDVNWNVE